MDVFCPKNILGRFISQKSSLYRTFEILKTLNQGKRLCVSTLALEYEVSDRTIRRDFELIKDLFGNFLHKEGECYRAYEKLLLDNVLNATNLTTLANIINLFDLADMQHDISDQTQALVDHAKCIYRFQTRPFEKLDNQEVIKKVEHSIRHTKELSIIYKTLKGEFTSIFQPYNILFLNENFYLVGINLTTERFEFLRIALIKSAHYTTKNFFHDAKVINFIPTIQTPWASFDRKPKLVKLRVKAVVKKYFLFKKYLPSQTVVQTFENGDIEVHYKVHTLREMEELVVKWLPHVSIISPRGLKRKIYSVLRHKLDALDTS
jgi:predicted DNA-binding transcriptional regulator YafY